MLYDRRTESGGISVKLENALEVETVRTAFEEHAAYLMDMGNDSSISDYQKEAIRTWSGRQKQEYRASNRHPLMDRLRYFAEVTDERVDELLDERDNPHRIEDSSRRYDMGIRAAHLVNSLELYAGMEEEWSEVLGE
jgi:hypothetical protein